MNTHNPFVVLRVNPTFGGGRVILLHLDDEGQETEIERLVSGEHPGQHPPDISEQIRKEIADGHRQFIIDLAQAPWLNSRGVGYIISLWTTITRAEGRPVLVNVTPRLHELLRITKLDRVFVIRDTMEAGREYLQSEQDNGH